MIILKVTTEIGKRYQLFYGMKFNKCMPFVYPLPFWQHDSMNSLCKCEELMILPIENLVAVSSICWLDCFHIFFLCGN